jgi:hypothetical protein
MATNMTKVGVGDYYRIIVAMKILFVVLYLYPKTFKLGFLLLSCVLAGAIATLLTHGQPFFSPAVPPAILWIATFLRDRSVFLTK